MSTLSLAVRNEHGLRGDTMSLKEPYTSDTVHNKRWGVLVETGSDAEFADARRGAAKSWHWGRTWKHFVSETFNNPKHATQPPLPTPPAVAGQSPAGDAGSRRISLTRSNAVHRPRSRNASSTLNIPGQTERRPYERDPDSPTPSMTSGESNADTPVDSPVSQISGHFTDCPEPSDRLEVPWESDELYSQPAAEALKPLPPVPDELGHAVDRTGRVAVPAQVGGPETTCRDIFDDTNRVTILSKTGIEPVTSTTNGHVEELLARIRSLEAELREKNNRLEKKDALVHDIANSLERRDALVNDIVNSLGSTDETWRSDEPPHAVAARVGRRMNETNSFLQSIDGALTQRNILMLKYVQRQGDTAAPASAITSEPMSPVTTGVFGMPPANLDAAMTLTQAAEYAATLDARQTLGASGTLSVKLCRICRIPKFLNAPAYPWMFSPSPSKHGRQTACELNELFSATGVTTCCAKAVCRKCYVAGLVVGAATDWWHDLGPERPADGRLDWLRCPMPTCSRPLSQQQPQPSGPNPPREPLGALIASRLADLGGHELTMHVFRFERAFKLRASLEALAPRPTPEALALAARLHAELVRQGRMRHLFTTSIGDADMAPRLLPFDSADGASTLRAPLFAGFLVSPSTPRESLCATPSSSNPGGGGGGSPPTFRHTTRDCSICCEAVRDAADGTPGDEARWAAAAAAFPGAWAVSARAFPTAAALPACAARHALDVCRGCLARHVSAQLDSRGRDAAGRLACPALGCGHVYSHDEVRSLLLPNVLSTTPDEGEGGGGEELFARYDRLCLLNHLSDIPGFMWCLREGCDNGQIHDVAPLDGDGDDDDDDDDDYNDRRPRWVHAARHKVTCESCSFAMCARHQGAWHEGLTCREWDELREDDEGNADPAEAASRRWIAANTKRCPGRGCGAPVEKGEGCFHMTCRRCSFEFCWECLADWSDINRARSRPAVQGGGHNLGCFFREAGAPMPTAIRGTSAREAARRAVR
ncbi:hypothetical protein RB600_008815 [Gaeumannomyces tritici]